MKIVAVSQRVDHLTDRNEVRDALDQRLITFLQVAGFIPVPVPNRLYGAFPGGQPDRIALDAWLDAIKPQAVVLSGGNDIGHCRERDLTEEWLLNHASQHRKPLLGICRGMQIMAHWAGVSLKTVKGHVRTRHCLSGSITGEVNSYHGFSLTACPDDFEILAKSEDGEIEAICHSYFVWEGWMWHPEREIKFVSRDIERVKALFS